MRLILLVLVLPKVIESISDRRAPDSSSIVSPSVTSEIPIDRAEKHVTMTPPHSALDPLHLVNINDPLPKMPVLPITSDRTVRACRALKVSPSRDVFVCSYPKSGTTWTQNIVVRLLWEISKNNRPLPEDWHLSYSAPFYEVDDYWRPTTRERQQQQEGAGDIDISKNNYEAGDSNIDPDDDEIMERTPVRTPIQNHDDGGRETKEEYRVFNTHLRPNQLPPNAKCVYLVRDPFDVMVSFYHHLSNYNSVEDGGYDGTLQEFCEEFMNGTIYYGKWQDHIEAWLGQQAANSSSSGGKNNFLLLHYEDMKNNLEKETKRLAKFLLDDGDNGDDAVAVEDRYLDELVSRVVPHCTFVAMKQEVHRYTPLRAPWKINPKTGKPYNEFVRKGSVGDGNEFLQRDASSKFKDRWVNHDAVIARARWNKAKVDAAIINRYL